MKDGLRKFYELYLNTICAFTMSIQHVYTKWDRANNFFTKRQQVNHSFVSIGLQTLWKSKAIFRLTTLHEIVLVQLALNEYFHFMYFTPYGVFFDLLSLSICLNSPTNGLIYLSFCYFISILCVMHNFLV